MEIREKINNIIVSLTNINTEINGITDEGLKGNVVVKKLRLTILSTIEKLEKSNISDVSDNAQLNTLIDEVINNFYTRIISFETSYYSDLLEKYSYTQNIVNSLLIRLVL